MTVLTVARGPGECRRASDSDDADAKFPGTLLTAGDNCATHTWESNCRLGVRHPPLSVYYANSGSLMLPRILVSISQIKQYQTELDVKLVVPSHDSNNVSVSYRDSIVLYIHKI